jgi:hypothetical protein
MKKAKMVLGLSAVVLQMANAACATDRGAPVAGETTGGEVAVADHALGIEQAERLLDRGGDAARARALLEQALSAPAISVEERSAAVVALSRAHEALGDKERAITVVEEELAARAEDRDFQTHALDKRLRLLLGAETNDAVEPARDERVAPFARVLGRYFPVDADDRVATRVYTFGGSRAVHERLGTFTIDAAVRAEREQTCPLCEAKLNVSSSWSRSDWTLIPAVQADFDRAVVAFYYDLGKNRIPARYEHHLPMKVADIERELADGKAFVVARDRAPAPPIVLLAAPRTAMLEEVEAHLASLAELPLERAYVPVAPELRPSEIKGVMRGRFLSAARACYDALRARAPAAGGRLELRFAVEASGAVEDASVAAADPSLGDPALAACLTSALGKLAFPASGKRTSVSYPLVLSVK